MTLHPPRLRRRDSWLRSGRLVSHCLGMLGATGLAATTAAETAPTPEGIAFFEAKVRPLLVEHCYKCHSAEKKQKGGLLLDSKAGWEKGGDTKPPIEPGDPEKSLLIQAVRWSDEDLRMPPEKAGGKLSDAEISDLAAWVKMGAPDPRTGAKAPAAGKTWPEIFAERRKWWDLQPVRAVDPPTVADASWSGARIDRFLRVRMEKEGIAPSQPASPRTLIRRASLVLTGLPPSPAEIEEFVQAADRKPRAAYEALVDRLIASPHFGERFARHWLDVVRFSETSGPEFNYDVPFAWRYRDYVIRAFNADIPYDQFVREHIAGDLLARPRRNSKGDFNESAIGTAFYRFGERSQESCVQFRGIGFDAVDNQLDTLTKAFQASTVTCARCHDHKLDAISTKDYYALIGILRSSRSVQRTLDDPAVNRDSTARLRALKPALREALASVWRAEAPAIDAARLSRIAGAEKAPPADTLKPQRASATGTPSISDPLYAWRKVFGTPQSEPEKAAANWRELAARQAKESAANAEFNRTGFTTLADFRKGSLDGWTADGMGLRDGAGRSGDFVVAHEGNAAIDAVLPAGVFTFALSEKLNGALRSPTLPKGSGFVSFEVVGGRSSMARLVFNNCQLSNERQMLHYPDWTWVTQGIPGVTDDLHPYAELVTFWDNPKFPEPTGTGDKESGLQRGPWSEHAKNPHTWWGVRRVVMHNRIDAPKDELTHLARLFTGPAPASAAEAAARYARIASDAVEAFAADRATDDDVLWLNWLIKSGLLSNRGDASPQLAKLTAQYREIEETQITLPRTMPGVADEGPGFDQPLLARGDFTKPGEPVKRRGLEMLARPGETFDTSGSGRRALADLIASSQNPLTARVIVNRIWQWIFGAGIVRSPDDFGHLGEKPSHPELLDDLAARFMTGGWSMKKLVREIALSQAFQTSAAPTPVASQRDPQDILLSHYPARREEAEVIRDNILAVSGRLDPALFGPSIDPYREKTDSANRLFAGPVDGNGRRSIYIKFQLMEAPRFLSAFNLPNGKITQGHRDGSNVPAQSLALLNDPFVLAMADFWARRLIKTPETPEARVDRMFRAALGRPPTPAEETRFIAALQRLADLRGVAWSDAANDRAIWKDAAHTIFNFSEFIFIL